MDRFLAEEEKKPEENANAETENLSLKMLKTRTLLLSGEINKELAEKVIKQLLLLEADGDDPIKMFIDSPGGDADAGFAIFDMIRFIKPRVITIGMGLIASAASIVLLASPAEDRIALPNSHFMIHQPLSGIRGVATEIEIHARELGKMKEKVNKLIAAESGKDIEAVAADTDRNFWLNAEEALEYKLVSRIVTTRDELES